jgi:ATP-dependent Clp protease adapter protein ClpS
MPGMATGGWQVVLWDDDINTVATVAFVLHRVAGLPIGPALEVPQHVNERGGAQVALFDDQADAEVLAARLQVFGLHGGVMPA